jgi:hypothetical protein
MNDREWPLFAAELEATFRGDLEPDQEAAIREHFGKVPVDAARAVVRQLVRDGQVFVPAASELVGTLRRVAGGSWEFECLLAGETSEERRRRLYAQWHAELEAAQPTAELPAVTSGR